MRHFPVILLLVAIVFFTLVSVTVVLSSTWNDKPVECMSFNSANIIITEKNEEKIFSGLQNTMVRSENGLAEEKVKIPVAIYANFEYNTFTIVEYHEGYDSFCIISEGDNFQ
tara:strand:- start:510 stop:845 length:336 start_codon:yes stop_codon:yes gene_type:complete